MVAFEPGEAGSGGYVYVHACGVHAVKGVGSEIQPGTSHGPDCKGQIMVACLHLR